nr:hypothetical protein [Escherichia coli]
MAKSGPLLSVVVAAMMIIQIPVTGLFTVFLWITFRPISKTANDTGLPLAAGLLIKTTRQRGSTYHSPGIVDTLHPARDSCGQRLSW